MLACASNDQGEQQLFSSVPVEADRQRQQLSAALRDLGATPTTPVTVLSNRRTACDVGRRSTPNFETVSWVKLATSMRRKRGGCMKFDRRCDRCSPGPQTGEITSACVLPVGLVLRSQQRPIFYSTT
jgi:hypothetical protein